MSLPRAMISFNQQVNELYFVPDVLCDMERIANPQDLNDALLAVRIEEATKQIALRLQLSHELLIRRTLLGGTP